MSAWPLEYRAPGRVNLIGEHTDYNLGYVMPVALDMSCRVAVTPLADGELQLRSNNLDAERAFPLAGLRSLEPSRDWTDYVIGVARELEALGVGIRPRRLVIESSVPVGSGLSSSAALEVAAALALLEGRALAPLELAQLCRRAEGGFVGMPCGIMDQYVSVFGQEHAAVLLDCRDLTHQVAPLPDGVEIVAVNSMVKHELGSSAYRDRVRECAGAAAVLGVSSLRDASSRRLDGLGGIPLKRARHITTENERVLQFAAACRQGDLACMGKLFVASHRSLQHDYEVSCEELDFLVDAAVALPGVYGARMTGGGFGGCTVNLVAPDRVEEFTAAIRTAYEEKYGRRPAVYVCRPAAGAGPVGAG